MLNMPFQIAAILMWLPAIAIAQTQNERAEYISVLSQIDRSDHTDFPPVSDRAESSNTNRKSYIAVTGCEITIKSVSFLPAQNIWEGILTTIDLAGLEIDKRTTLDGKTRRFIHWPENGDASNASAGTAAFGDIQFFFEVPGTLFRFTNSSEISPSELIPTNTTPRVMVHSATYRNEHNPTEQDISILVDEILAYQSDYCLPDT